MLGEACRGCAKAIRDASRGSRGAIACLHLVTAGAAIVLSLRLPHIAATLLGGCDAAKHHPPVNVLMLETSTAN